jgi:Txe/YoeB family toxin of Txe-Axe toxin-antitoxin module
MKDMKKLEELLWKELGEYKQRDKLSMSDLEIVHKVTDTLKNIEKIEKLERENMGEYSHRTHGAEPRYGSRYYYNDEGGNSYRMGRSYDSGEYDRGRSHGEGTEQMVGKLERMMDDADPKTRDMLQRFIGQIQNS